MVCEKPLCFTVAEAEALRKLVAETNRVLGVTYGYAGYPMIEQARQMIARGDLGEIRIVNMQFAHGFHSEAVEAAMDAYDNYRQSKAHSSIFEAFGEPRDY